MAAPESSISQDAALSNLMSAAIGSPETSAPVPSAQAAQQAYDTPAAVAQRIEQYIGRYGQENTSTLLLYEAMKALRNPAALALPKLNADLIGILGRPNFTCIRLAQLLRLSGVEIATKAEAEQATVIHYLLGFYLRHGGQWAEEAGKDIEKMRIAAVAAQQGKGHMQ